MKSLYTFLLAFSLLSGQAMATSNNGLKAAFDDLNYALEVEWDQVDANFHKAQTDLFEDRIRQLHKQGLTNSEMMDFALSEIKDQKVRLEVSELFMLVNANKLSEVRALEIVQSLRENSSASGANWHVSRIHVTGIAFVVIVAALVTWVKLSPGVDN